MLLKRVQASRALDFSSEVVSLHQTLQRVLSPTVCHFLRVPERQLPRDQMWAERLFVADCVASARLAGSLGGAGFLGISQLDRPRPSHHSHERPVYGTPSAWSLYWKSKASWRPAAKKREPSYWAVFTR